ncbi:MAG: NAD(P)H-dependent oxidoreductase subunit E [Candidatus Rokubacteria bacterium]|nr:NAD(P)H-dependent oxidoreductase subunit E [Candidatus Rokubacteria bacterium]
MISHDPAALGAILARFPRERRRLLPALHAVQRSFGYLSEAVLVAVSAHLRVPVSEVYGVATGYPELRVTPAGRHHVRVCTGVTCSLLGGRDLLARLAARFGAAPAAGDSPEVTLESADCFFQCAVAPLVEVDAALAGRVTAEDAGAIEQRFAGAAAIAPEIPHAGTRLADEPRRLEDEPSRRGDARSERRAARGSASETLDDLVQPAQARRAAAPPLRIIVQAGTCGRAVGAGAVLGALREAVRVHGLGCEVVEGSCNGMCYAAPVVGVERRGWPWFVLERVTAAAVPALVERLAGGVDVFDAGGSAGIVWADSAWGSLTPAGAHPFWRGQERVLLDRAGTIDPGHLDDALVADRYRQLARALDGRPDDVIAEVKAAGLRGNGGAFFPAAVKWEACRKASGEPKYLVMNGEEGEPGIFKDRHLMEADPHRVLEGVLIAAYAAGATRVILYVHGEADLSAARLARAVAEAEAAGIVGPRMLGRDVHCEVEIRRGAGGFVLGEETALLESIEGRRAQPRTRPPFPVESGLWGKPTVVNNVETLAAVPAVLALGAARFMALGTDKAPGTKVFGLSGPIVRPGVVEVRNGVTLSSLLHDIGGGLPGGGRLLGALVGGPSGSVVPAALFDVPMEPRGQVSPGTGGIVAIPEGVSIVDVVKTLLAFNAAESCGKCTPCREGAPRLLAMVDELRAAPDDETVARRARDLAETMQSASLCGLGQAAPIALLRALEDFAADFRASS